MRIYFATWLFDRTLGESLSKLNAEACLLSFYFLRELNLHKTTSKTDFERYVRTGIYNPRKGGNFSEN